MIPQAPILSYLATEAIRPPSRADSKNELDLQRVRNAWPTLPAALRVGILAMIDAAQKDG